MSVSAVATGNVRSAWSGIMDIVIKYVMPLGGFLMGLSTVYAENMNVGYLIDKALLGNEMVAKFWKEGYGRLIGGSGFTSVGLLLITKADGGFKGAIMALIGGILAGVGVAQLYEGMQKLGVA